MWNFASLLPPEPLPQRISRILAWIAGAVILFGCSLLITIDVITRFFLKRGVVESFEISGYCLAIGIGLGMAFTVYSRSNVRVDILLGILPAAGRVAANLLAASSLAALAVALAWFAWNTPARSWALNAKSLSELQTPLVVPQAIWWFGLCWFAIVAILVLVQAVRRLLAGDQAGCDELIGSLQASDEIEQSGMEQLPAAKQVTP